MRKLLILSLIAVGTIACARYTAEVDTDKLVSASPTPTVGDIEKLPGTGLDEASPDDIKRD